MFYCILFFADRSIRIIDHTGFSVTNLEDSKLFYTSVLASLGHIARLEIPDKAVGFGPARPDEGSDPGGAFWIAQGTPATPRMHLAFSAKNKEEVDAFHSTALRVGGKIMVHRDTGLNIILDITPRLSLILMGTILRLFTTRHDNDSRLGSVWITSGYASFIK